MQRTGRTGWRIVLVALVLLPGLLGFPDRQAAAQVSGSTFTSPQYGYSIRWPAPFTSVSQSANPPSEYLSLGDGASFVYFTASNAYSTAGYAADTFAEFIRGDEDYSNVADLPASRCVAGASPAPAAVQCFQIDRRQDSGATVTEGLLLQTWDLGNEFTLIMLASVSLEQFDAYLPLFGQIVVTPPDSGGTIPSGPAGVSNAPGISPDSHGGIVFSFDPGISDADRNDAVEGALLGQDVIGGFVGTDGLDGERIVVSAEASAAGPSVMASTRGQQITVYAGGSSWQNAPSLIRIETLVHELMHVYQNALEQNAGSVVPLWFDEGTAEALGYLAITRLGVVDQSDIYALNQYLLTRYPYDGSLAGLQAYDSMNADSYPLAYIAVQYLLGRGGLSVSALTQVYEGIGSGQSFAAAFQTVFGQSPDDFYVEFDAWRTGLVQVSAVPVDFVTPPYAGDPATATWQQVQSQIARGDQLMLVVVTAPGASCTVQILVPGSPIQREADANGEGEVFWLITVPDSAPAGHVSARAACGGAAVWQDVTVT